MSTAIEDAKNIIRQRQGIIRTAEALQAGIHPRTLYALRDQGVLEQFSRGVYRLAELPPTAVYHFSKPSFAAGVGEHKFDGTTIRVYNQEKTMADCFKFRNTLGMDVVLEALKLYKQQGSFKVMELLEYAAICRVKNVMKPYLEVVI